MRLMMASSILAVALGVLDQGCTLLPMGKPVVDAQDIAVEYATALAQSALDRTSTGRGGKLQAEDVLFVVRKVTVSALLAQMSLVRGMAQD